MALIPPEYMHYVVAIGVDTPKGPQWSASGFLYGQLVSPARLEHKKQKYVFGLVTNRHVFDGKNNVLLRFNPIDEKPPEILKLRLLDQDSRKMWRSHKNQQIDVAVAIIDLKVLRARNIQFGYFLSNTTTANIKDMVRLGVTEGDFAYVLGFPMGLVGEKRQTVLVRSGTIARIRDALARTSKEFLIDAFVFPGNSGGPVILKPEGGFIGGTKPQLQAQLIGIVTGYVRYTDAEISEQTGEIRVIFQENSGLAAAHPMDYVQKLMKDVIKELRATPQQYRDEETV